MDRFHIRIRRERTNQVVRKKNFLEYRAHAAARQNIDSLTLHKGNESWMDEIGARKKTRNGGWLAGWLAGKWWSPS